MPLAIIFYLSFYLPMTNPSNIDFGKGADGQNWSIIVDGVMGGLSRAEKQVTEETILFKGTVSLENNGGFASLRGPWGQYDLSTYNTLEIKYRLTGHAVGISLEVDRRWYKPNFKQVLPTTDGEWQTIKLSMQDFEQYNIGRKTGYLATANALAAVQRIGFITYDKKAGNFEMEIDYISFH